MYLYHHVSSPLDKRSFLMCIYSSGHATHRNSFNPSNGLDKWRHKRVRKKHRINVYSLLSKVRMNMTIHVNSSPMTSKRIHFIQLPAAECVYWSFASSDTIFVLPRFRSNMPSVDSSVCRHVDRMVRNLFTSTISRLMDKFGSCKSSKRRDLDKPAIVQTEVAQICHLKTVIRQFFWIQSLSFSMPGSAENKCSAHWMDFKCRKSTQNDLWYK